MALLGFIGFLSMSSQRMCITVALVCMLNQTAMTGTDFKPLPLQPTTTPSAIVAVPPINGSVDVVVAGDSDTAAARHRVAATPPPEKACGEIPEIFVLNTSDFSRVNVSTVLILLGLSVGHFPFDVFSPDISFARRIPLPIYRTFPPAVKANI